MALPLGRSLATILFIDIVGSTQRAADQGDAAWRLVLDSFFGVARRQIRKHGGQEINTTGDGLVAAFDRPAPGIYCAWAIRDGVRGLGVEVRSGLHMGEVEKRGTEIGGIAVHIACRVAEQAQAGEVLVSRTIREAEEGSGFRFSERGAQELKGVKGEWHLFSVEEVPELDSTLYRNVWLASAERRGLLVGASAFVLLLLLAGLYASNRDPAVIRNDRSSLEPLNVSHRQVTFLGNVFKAAVSPDERTIAYITRYATEDDRLFVRDLAGGEPLEIVRYEDVFSVRWSPTGENLLVGVGTATSGSGAILLIPRLGGIARKFSFARFFDWSPDARRFVFAGYQSKQLIFRDIATDETDSIALPDSFDTFNGLDWSPQGDRIAYLTHEEPSRSSIWTIRVSGEGAHRVVDDTLPLATPRWAWTGDAIYYKRGRDQSGQTSELARVEISRATGETLSQPRVFVPGEMGYFDLFKDGNRILYVGGHGYTNLWLFQPDASGDPEITQLTQGTALKLDPSVSPDGRQVAFTMLMGESANIYLMAMEGGPTTQLTHFEGRTCCPAWSPDGAEIAFFSTHRGERRIWRVAAGGGTPRKYPVKETRTEPSVEWGNTIRWAPGAKILYSSGATHSLYLLDPTSGEVQPLISRAGSDSIVCCMYFPHISPDATKIAGAGRGVRVISLIDGEQTFVSDQWQIVLGWSPDGKWIYAYKPNSSSIVRYSSDGLSTDVVTSIECGSEVGGVAMAPDGKRFVCVGLESQPDLWIMETSSRP